MKTVAVKFSKSPTGKFDLAYWPGDVAELSELQAQMVIEAGYGYKVDPEPVSKINLLPEDIPYRELLIELGVKSVAELRKYGDLTSFKGIGRATDRKIQEWLSLNSD